MKIFTVMPPVVDINSEESQCTFNRFMKRDATETRKKCEVCRNEKNGVSANPKT